MRIFRHFNALPPAARGSAVAVGNFDGVHLGHQAILRELKERALRLAVPAVVVTFEPQPIEYFSPLSAPPRLTTFREKYEALTRHSVDRMVCLRFGGELARLTGRAFVEDLLVGGLGVRCVIVGDDFRFGRSREGDLELLARLAPGSGYDVVPTETCMLHGTRISSSGVRAALAGGDMAAACAMLGRPYRISGRVMHGDKRGRELGFPTANIDLSRRRSPLHGIFAVRVYGGAGVLGEGVANVGTRPMFGDGGWLLEAHLFDFNSSIYGQRIEVEFLKRIRDEQTFESVTELRSQIEKDVAEAKAFFRKDTGIDPVHVQERRP